MVGGLASPRVPSRFSSFRSELPLRANRQPLLALVSPVIVRHTVHTIAPLSFNLRRRRTSDASCAITDTSPRARHRIPANELNYTFVPRLYIARDSAARVRSIDIARQVTRTISVGYRRQHHLFRSLFFPSPLDFRLIPTQLFSSSHVSVPSRFNRGLDFVRSVASVFHECLPQLIEETNLSYVGSLRILPAISFHFYR